VKATKCVDSLDVLLKLHKPICSPWKLNN